MNPDIKRFQSARGASGFTLIEVMVVVAIIGIIASIALPSYNEHVRKTRRAAGGACALAVAQQLERFYTANMTYTGVVANTAICQDSALDYYNIVVVANGRTYTISANPTGTHSGDACGTLGVNQAGTRDADGTNCW
ncbi:type IV pilin protein [Luteimonas sp. A534]